jgi:hypothetical protein
LIAWRDLDIPLRSPEIVRDVVLACPFL